MSGLENISSTFETQTKTKVYGVAMIVMLKRNRMVVPIIKFENIMICEKPDIKLETAK